MIPGFDQVKTLAIVAAVLVVLGVCAAVGVMLEKRGYAHAVAVLQPKLDKANQDIGVLQSANQADEQTIADMRQNEQANDALIASQNQQIADADQQANDAAAAIRKLQQNDQSVDAFLRIPIPDALRSVLNDTSPANQSGAANQNGHAAAAKAGGLPRPSR